MEKITFEHCSPEDEKYGEDFSFLSYDLGESTIEMCESEVEGEINVAFIKQADNINETSSLSKEEATNIAMMLCKLSDPERYTRLKKAIHPPCEGKIKNNRGKVEPIMLAILISLAIFAGFSNGGGWGGSFLIVAITASGYLNGWLDGRKEEEEL